MTERPSPRSSYMEPFRPQVHYTPALHWMNDPNGLVYDDGEYHLFYQYNPFGATWGHMSWGHAVSRDLVHWTELPVALPETRDMMIFSGSAVADRENTSGLGTKNKPPLVALFTGHHTKEQREAQYLAYSLNQGRTWTLHEGNPVLDRGLADFRDPKVFWYEPGAVWIMAVALPPEQIIQLYASEDLQQWRHLSDFGPAGTYQGAWECPDLFELPVEGGLDETRWVLHVSVDEGALAGGSGGQYFIGTFDGVTFIPDTVGDDPAVAPWTPTDHGADFYAVASWSGLPEDDGRRVWIGWMNNWRYARDLPTAPWRGAQSLPRQLALRRIGGSLRLVQQPVDELQHLRGEHWHLEALPIGDRMVPLAPHGIAGTTLEFIAEMEPGTAREVGLRVRVGKEEATVIGVNLDTGTVFVDRRQSSSEAVHAALVARHEGPLDLQNGRVRLHVFVDASSVEVFAGAGETTITDRIFPAPDSDGVDVYARGGTARLTELDGWALESIWKGAP